MESKRIFNQAKMNRDIDDRLLPEGSYRYANNVNIGESEGGDIGAVENLKGNHPVGAIDDETSETIGVIRDPNNDRVYWFTKGDEFDAIYEYDDTTGEVVPILKDSVDRDLVKPTCVPTFTTFVNDPDSDPNDRPTPSFSYKTPVGGCTDSSANNFNSTATFDDGSCTFDPPPPSTSLSVLISGDGTFANSESPVTLTATASEVLGTVSYLWDTGETTQTISVSGADATITGSVTVTDSGRTTDNTATDNYSVTFQSVAPTKYTWGFSSTGTTGAGTTISGSESGQETTEGVSYTPVGTSMVAIDSPTTMRWATLPTAVISGNPSGVGISAVNGTVGTSTAANVSLTGSYTPTQNEFATITWSGGSVEAIPAMFGASVAISTWPDYIIFSSGGQTLGTSAGSDQATYTFSNLPAGVFSFNAAIAWSSPSLGVEFFLEDRAISTVLGNPTTAGFNITFPPGTPTTFSETLTADIVITVNGGIFDGEEVTITSGATQTSQFA